jgi:hypothetical protein
MDYTDGRLSVEEAAKQDADACWKALEGKLSPEKYVPPVIPDPTRLTCQSRQSPT